MKASFSAHVANSKARAVALALAALGLTVALGACDSTSTLTQTTAAEPAAADLSPAQAEAVQGVARKYAGEVPTPGVLWPIAADLQSALGRAPVQQLSSKTKAQRAHHRGHRGAPRKGPRHGWMRGLDLADAQKAALRALREEYRPQRKALRQARRDGSFSEDAAARARALRKAMRAKRQAILTDAQRRQIEAQRAERKERRAAMRQARQAALALSGEQKAQLREQWKAHAEQRREEPARQGARHARRHHRGHDREAFASILTDAQRGTMTLHRLLSHRAHRMRAAHREE